MLIAGTTGSGKSVCINSMLISLLYKSTPEEVRLIMVDPKMVELGNYNGIPHLLIPVVTDPKKAAGALNWAVGEMERRYKLFADHQVRNLVGYNDLMRAEKAKAEAAAAEGETAAAEQYQVLPQIVIVIDELADLMMVAAKEVENSICRIAQKARAAGMHLVVATQRPSSDVITGIMKANIPSPHRVRGREPDRVAHHSGYHRRRKADRQGRYALRAARRGQAAARAGLLHLE